MDWKELSHLNPETWSSSFSNLLHNPFIVMDLSVYACTRVWDLAHRMTQEGSICGRLSKLSPLGKCKVCTIITIEDFSRWDEWQYDKHQIAGNGKEWRWTNLWITWICLLKKSLNPWNPLQKRFKLIEYDFEYYWSPWIFSNSNVDSYISKLWTLCKSGLDTASPASLVDILLPRTPSISQPN